MSIGNLETRSGLTTRAGNLSTADVVLAGVCVGAVVTLFGYRYGDSLHIEFLPQIIRELDPGYLPNDWSLNEFQKFSPRYYSVKALALMARTSDGLPYVLFGLTLWTNTLTALVTALFARDCWGRSNLAGILAASLAVGVGAQYLGLGGAAYLTSPRLITSSLAVPYALAAVWAARRDRLVIAALSGGFAAIIHPLVGFEVAGLALVTSLVYRTWGGGCGVNRRRLSAAVPPLVGLAVLLVFTAFWLIPAAGKEKISDERFLHAVLMCLPCHYVPSYFPVEDFLKAVGFVAASGWSLWWLKAEGGETARQSVTWVSILATLLFLTFVAGSVFVEVVPLRLAVVAQVYRMVILLEWLGLVSIAGALAGLFHGVSGRARPGLAGWLLMCVPMPLLAGTVFPAALALEGRRWGVRPVLVLTSVVASSVMCGVLLAAALKYHYVIRGIEAFYAARIFSLVALTSTLAIVPARRSARAILVLSTAALLCGGVLWGVSDPSSYPTVWLRVLEPLRPTFSSPQDDSLTHFLRDEMGPETVLLTPPEMGHLRFTARRALVVDPTMGPMHDKGLWEWYVRLVDCYGPEGPDFNRLSEMSQSYARIDESRLDWLHNRYGFSHAVVPDGARTRRREIFRAGGWKVVRFDEPQRSTVPGGPRG